jgi:PmbA protein
MAKEMIDLRESEDGLKGLVSDILGEAERQGATAAEVSVSEDVGLSVSVRKGELETVEFNQDRGFGITVYYGQRKGSASTSDSSHGAIEETVRAARNIARHTEEDPCSGLADADLMPDVLPELDLYHPWNIDAAAAEELALNCEAAGLSFDARIVNSDGASTSTQQSCRVYGNSHGFIGSYLGTRHSVSCMLIAEDEAGMQRDYWYTMARNADQLEDVRAVGEEAGRRTTARLSPRKTATGSFPVVYCPQMASGLIGHLMGAISGGSLYRKASFLLDSLGQQVASPQLGILEEPHLPGRLGSAGFDGDGVATWDKAFIKDGVVENYVLSSYSGRKLDMPTTGNAGGVFNLRLTGDTRPVADLYKSMGTGLLVTELMGQGVNSVTGDYSRGASGFWVENGEIAYPVDEITIASNLKDMYCDIQLLGDDVDERGNIRAPSILIGAMTLAGE